MIDPHEDTTTTGEPDPGGQSSDQSDDAGASDRAAVGRFESF
ncbi:hypothetical protein [Kitasatospora purpeofusca]